MEGLIAKLEDMSLIPWSHVVEGEDQLVLWHSYSGCGVSTCVHSLTRTIHVKSEIPSVMYFTQLSIARCKLCSKW